MPTTEARGIEESGANMTDLRGRPSPISEVLKLDMDCLMDPLGNPPAELFLLLNLLLDAPGVSRTEPLLELFAELPLDECLSFYYSWYSCLSSMSL